MCVLADGLPDDRDDDDVDDDNDCPHWRGMRFVDFRKRKRPVITHESEPFG